MKLDIRRGRTAALALLATSALAGGVLAGGPADAAGTHTVTVQASPGTSGLAGGLNCSDPNGPGTYNDAAGLSSSGRATFTGVPDGYDCYGYAYDNNPIRTYDYNESADQTVTDDTVVLTVTLAARTDFHCSTFSSISGPVAVAQTLTAVVPATANGTLDPSTVKYYWYRVDYVGGQLVETPVQTGSAQQSNPHYTATEADYGHQLEVYIDGTSTTGASLNDCVPAVSSPVGRVGTPAPRRPAVRGKAVVGHRLVARSATAPAGTSVAGYQWYYEKIVKKGGRAKVVYVKIRGAKHSVYRLKKRDEGKLVVVGITYTRPSYNPTVLISKAKRVK